MPHIIKRIEYVGYAVPIASLAALFYLWNTTNPVSIGPLGILAVFVLLYIFWASLFFIVLHLGFVLFKRTFVFKFLMRRREGRPFHWQLAYYIASIVAFIPVLLIAMQSVNQLTFRDVALVFLFVSLAVFYVVKRS